MPTTQKTTKAKADPFKQNAKITWSRKNGEKASGVVRGRETLANGVWLKVKVEGQADLSKVRIKHARLT